MCNASTWGLTKNEETSLDSFHRRQLRTILNVKYPHRMKNREVYRLTDENPISLQIMISRWKLFGHILRLNERTPAKKAMQYYFEKSNSSKFKGRPRVTLPIKLSCDIKSTIESDRDFLRDYSVLELKTKEDLEILNNIARDRNTWIELTNRIYKVAEAAMRL